MNNTAVSVCVRLNRGEDFILNDISLNQDTIKQIKNQIACHIKEEKSIRLIYRGQLLNNDFYTLSDYGVLCNTSLIHLHCALSDNISLPNTNTKTAIYHNNTTPKNTSEYVGFDKLRENGYNEEEIRNIRLEFHQANYIDGEPPNEECILLEEAWLEENGRILPPERSQSSFKEMLCGLLLGLFLGVLCLFWVRESVFTRRHQMGILAGMLINVQSLWYLGILPNT